MWPGRVAHTPGRLGCLTGCKADRYTHTFMRVYRDTPGLVCASEQYPLSYLQGIGIADVTEKEAATGQEGALDERQARC